MDLMKDDTKFYKYKRFIDSKEDHPSDKEISSIMGKHFLLQIHKFSEKRAFDKIKEVNEEGKSDLDKEKDFYRSKINNLLDTNDEIGVKLMMQYENEELYDERNREEWEDLKNILLRVTEECEYLNVFLESMKSEYEEI